MKPEIVERYTLPERINHWVAGLSYIYLLLTGLAFYAPNFWWLASLLGGGPVVRFWHPILGLLFVTSVLLMFRAWGRDMRVTDADKKWAAAMKYYVQNQDDKLPPVGRFNAGQKQFFWIMFLGGLALLASGVVLWFTELLPWSLRWLRYAAVLIHVTAFLASVAGFIVHIYMGTAVVRGGFTSIIRGHVTRAWAEHHHPLWLKEVSNKK